MAFEKRGAGQYGPPPPYLRGLNTLTFIYFFNKARNALQTLAAAPVAAVSETAAPVATDPVAATPIAAAPMTLSLYQF